MNWIILPQLNDIHTQSKMTNLLCRFWYTHPSIIIARF